MKKTLSILLALAMLLSLVACTGNNNNNNNSTGGNTNSGTTSTATNEGDTSKYPEYLNLESASPIIKDEFKGQYVPDVMIITSASESGDYEKSWLKQYLENVMNVEMNVEAVLGDAWGEKMNVMFVSDDLPDMILEGGFGPANAVKYGMEEQLLLKLDEYVDETLTPGIAKMFSNPNYLALGRCPDGHVYALPYATGNDMVGALDRSFINKKTLDQMGLEEPETLDELVEALYKFKETDPNGVGTENCFPWSGGMDGGQVAMTYYLLNAFGYLGNTSNYGTTNQWGYCPALRNGEVVIPVYDMEVYKEFLTLMHQFYVDGIINPNFFTIEESEVMAQLAGNQNLVYRDPVFVTGLDTWADWECVTPLTSKWHEKKEWNANVYGYGSGNVALAATTEYPELCMRIADLWYNEDYPRVCGPTFANDSDIAFGFTGVKLDDDGRTFVIDGELPDGKSDYNYTCQDIISFFPHFGYKSSENSLSWNERQYEAFGGKYDPKWATEYDLSTSGGQYLDTVQRHVFDYQIEKAYPQTIYQSSEDTVKRSDLTDVLVPYIREQVAKFITGERSLDETDAFVEELESMGIQDLLQMYKDIYEQYYAE